MSNDDENHRLRAKNRALYNALKNYHGFMDTPVARRVFDGEMAIEAREIARAVLNHAELDEFEAGAPPVARGDRYGFSNEHPDHPMEAWRYEADNGDTVAGYHDWVLGRVYMELEEEASPSPGV